MDGRTAHYHEIEQFFAGWQTYQKVITHNYLFHREMAEHLASFLAGTWPQESIAVLDLGCGDAAQLAPVLAQANVASYTGVDLSGPALELARGNLQNLHCPVRVLKANYCHLLDALSGPYDLIHNSYSLHHLSRADKATYFQHCQRLLAPGGVHVLVDIMCQPGESRDACVRREANSVHETYACLDVAERREVMQHMLQHDHPETEETLRMLAAQAGLEGWQERFRTPLQGMFTCRAVSQEV